MTLKTRLVLFPKFPPCSGPGKSRRIQNCSLRWRSENALSKTEGAQSKLVSVAFARRSRLRLLSHLSEIKCSECTVHYGLWFAIAHAKKPSRSHLAQCEILLRLKITHPCHTKPFYGPGNHRISPSKLQLTAVLVL